MATFYFVSFHVLAKPREKAKVTNRGFMVAWGDLNEYLEYDKNAKGMYCRACREAKMDSVWGLKFCTHMRKSRVSGHAASIGHRANVEALKKREAAAASATPPLLCIDYWARSARKKILAGQIYGHAAICRRQMGP